MVLQVLSQVDVLRGVRVVQQLSVTWIHQVDAELNNLLHWSLGDDVWKLRVLQDNKQTVKVKVELPKRRRPADCNNTTSDTI